MLSTTLREVLLNKVDMIIVLAVAGTIDLYWYDTARYTSRFRLRPKSHPQYPVSWSIALFFCASAAE